MEKKCGKCKEVKTIEAFNKDRTAKDGLQNNCNTCIKKYRQENKEKIKERSKEYYQENKEKIKEKIKKYYQENKEKIKERKKEYYQENKERSKERSKEYRQENKEKIKERSKEYRQENKEKIKERRKKYRQDNKEKIKKYRQDNKEKIKERGKEYYQENKERSEKYRQDNKEKISARVKERRATNPMVKMTTNLRNRTAAAFRRRGYKKDSKTMEMLGVEWEVVSKYIEKKFTPKMNWDNQGTYWHIDHIYPLSLAKDEAELKRLCHYTNLQPLEATDNIVKGNKITEHQRRIAF